MTLFLAAILLAGEPEPEFTIGTAEGRELSGPLKSLTADRSLSIGGEKLISGNDWLGLRHRGVLLPALPMQHVLFLSNGDCVPLDPKGTIKLLNERLQCVPALPLRPDNGADMALPYSALAVLWLAAPGNSDELEDFRRRLLLETRKRDVLVLRNGDRVEGTLTLLDGIKGCTVKTTIGQVNVPWGDLAVLAFNSELQSKRLPKKAFPHVVLRNGGRLSFAALESQPGDKQLVGKTFSGVGLRFPLEELAAMDVRQHRTVYLSDLKPKKYEHTPYFNLSWPLLTDAAVTGRALRLAGNTFDKGLGMHAISRVTYVLDGQFQRFEALVGLDENTGKRGRVKIEVLVDGKVQNLGFDGERKFTDPPLALRLDVRKAQELTLVVNCGSRADVQTHVNWADARLVK